MRRAKGLTLLARKNLFEEPSRALVGGGGVALAVLLSLLLWGVLKGTLRQAASLVRNTDAQVWVAQRGFTDMLHGYSILPEFVVLPLSSMPGVSSAHPITTVPTQFRLHGKVARLFVVGYDTRTGVGGPWRYVGPARAPKSGEIVVDHTFARVNSVKVGDSIPLPDHPRTVVAFSDDTNQIVSQLAFTDISDVRTLTGLDDGVSFFALRTRGRDASDVAARVERFNPDLLALPSDRFAARTESAVREGLDSALYVVAGLGFIVGLGNVALAIYATTIEKSREYGALMAVGAGRRSLYGVVIRQAFMSTALGFLFGCLLLDPARRMIGLVSPKVQVLFGPQPFAVVVVGVLVMAALASSIPVRRLSRLDPADVFRA